MGQSLFTTEMDIDVSSICCGYLILKDPPTYFATSISLDLSSLKENISLLNKVKPMTLSHIVNRRRHIQIYMTNGVNRIISISDCGKYVGRMSPSDAYSTWYHLSEEHPFSQYTIKHA